MPDKTPPAGQPLNTLYQRGGFGTGKAISGSIPRYTPKRLAEALASYMAWAAEQNQWLTVGGACLYLGIDTSHWPRFVSGEYGRTESAQRAYRNVVGRYLAAMQAQAEGRLFDGQNTAGVQFWLRNVLGWRDDRHVSVETTERRLEVVVNQQLADRLAGSATVLEHDSSP